MCVYVCMMVSIYMYMYMYIWQFMYVCMHADSHIIPTYTSMHIYRATSNWDSLFHAHRKRLSWANYVLTQFSGNERVRHLWPLCVGFQLLPAYVDAKCCTKAPATPNSIRRFDALMALAPHFGPPRVGAPRPKSTVPKQVQGYWTSSRPGRGFPRLAFPLGVPLCRL